jgi:RNA-directed DNA polymerase
MALIDDLSEYLDLSTSELIANMNIASKSYKVFSIKKRGGGDREIAQPTPLVKRIQKGICNIMLIDFDYSDATTAYRVGFSIVDNAKPHTGHKFILKMDFKDFFPSIKPIDLLDVIEKRYTLSHFEQSLIVNYLFRKVGRAFELSVGAPSSPMISNLVMKQFDIELQGFSSSLSIPYTRYADDLTFSSDSYSDLERVKEFVIKLVARYDSPCLAINEKKTRIVGRGRSQRVTGIVLTQDGEVSVGRTLRKRVRGMLHLYSRKLLKQKDIPYLHGMISHIRSVESDFFSSMLELHGEKLFERLAKQSYTISKNKKNKLVQ